MTRELAGLTVHLSDRVYRPAEDSLLLAGGLEAPPEGRALDLCTGCGLAALKLAEAGARTVATDVNPHACRLTRRNAAANDLRVHVVRTDLAAGIRARFEAVTCNPPYLPTAEADPVRGTPARALHAGPDGAEVARAALDALPGLLTPEGRAWLVVSSLQPEAELAERARERGLTWTVRETVGVGRLERLSLVELRPGIPPGRDR